MKLFTPKDLQLQEKYKSTHDVEKVRGTEVDLAKLKEGERVLWGDGESYHYLLIPKKPIA